MPLLSPKQLSGLTSEIKKHQPPSKEDLKGLLEEKALTPGDVLDKVRMELDCGETGSVRLKAAEMALKLNGLLQNKDESASGPVVVINIKDSEFEGLNPILITRG